MTGAAAECYAPPMTRPIRTWICAAYHAVYRCGGWAAVRVSQGQASGAAGGERHTTARRTALAGLAAAMRDLPAAGEAASSQPVFIQTTSVELAGFATFLAGLGGTAQAAAPDEDLDLWAQIVTGARGRPLELVHTALEPGGPSAFVSAWADLARDKAKASGPFTAAIPKPNLAKFPGRMDGEAS